MKKIYHFLFLVIIINVLFGCTSSAVGSVKDYLDKYNSLDEYVTKDINNIILAEENISEDNKNLYKQLFEKQYTNLKYSIENEEYNGDEAVITVKITVYDYFKVQNEATDYLKDNPDEFNDESGNYNIDKFITYKLKQMELTKETISYSIDFYVMKTSDGWTVSELSNTDLEKIHGIYNYESK